MSATITHISATSGAGAPGQGSGLGAGLKAGANADPAAGNGNGGLSQGLEGLFSALLSFAQQSGSAAAQQNAGPFLSQLGIDRSALNKMAVDIGGKIDLSGILTAGGADANSNSSADASKKPDPLAAIIAGLLAGLQNLQNGSQPALGSGTAGQPVNGEKLVGALSDFLAAIEAKMQATNSASSADGATGNKPFAQTDPAILDQLKDLSKSLHSLIRSPGASVQPQANNPDAAPGQSVKLDAQLMGSLQQIAHRVDALLTGSDGSARQHPAHTTVLSSATMANPASLLPAETSAQAAAGANPSLSANKLSPAVKTDAEKRIERVASAAKSLAQSGSQSGSQANAQAQGSGTASSTGTDPLSALNQIAPHHHLAASAAFRPAGFAPQQAQAQVNLPTLAYEFVRQVSAGNTRFEIRLDPAEMGKIDVKIDIDKTGAMHARLSVEKAETLDLLQRDARSLERALTQAGLEGTKPNLEFSLKQNPFAGQQFAGQSQDQNQRQSRDWQTDDPLTASDEPAPLQATQAYRGIATPGGVNLLA